jgi:hypothetical protein
MVINNMCIFLQSSIYYRTVAARSSVMMVGATPSPNLLLEDALGQQAICQL